jgi:hypothetical protein
MMATKTIKFDDGTVSRIDVPDGASKDDINAFVSSNMEAIKAKAKPMVQQRETYDYQDKDAGNIGHSLLRGATFDMSDEIMGGIAATYAKMHDMVTGNQSGISYNAAVNAVRGDQEAFAERNPGVDMAAQIAGGVMTGGVGGAKILGSQALKQAPKFAKAAAVPLVAGAEGAAFGFGSGEGMEDSLENAGQQGLISAVTGPLLNKLGQSAGNKLFKKEATKIQQQITPTKTLESLTKDSKDFYKAAENSGVIVKGSTYKPFRDKLLDFLEAEAIDGQTYPKIGKAVRRLAKLENPSYKDIEAVKKLLKQARISSVPDDRRVGRIIGDEVDNLIDNLTPADLIAGKVDDLSSNLKNAKKLWSQKSQVETIDEIEQRAKRSSAFRDQDDLDKAVRSKVVPTLDNPRKKIGLDENVVSSLEEIVSGTPGKKLARSLAGITPGSHTQRGLIPTVGAAGVGVALTGSPAGLILGIVPGISGSVARKIANKMTKKELETLKNAIVNKGQLESDEIIQALMEQYAPLIAGASASVAGSTSGEANTTLQDMMQ